MLAYCRFLAVTRQKTKKNANKGNVSLQVTCYSNKLLLVS